MKKLLGNRKVKRVIIAIVIVAVVIVALRFILFPPTKEIPTTGEYRITSEDYWVNEDKTDPYFRNGRNRQLQVRRWYPIDCTEDKPIVVASHGSCGTIDNNRTLYRELASHGYTVLAVTAIMDGGFQKADAIDQLTKLNADCLTWVTNLTDETFE